MESKQGKKTLISVIVSQPIQSGRVEGFISEVEVGEEVHPPLFHGADGILLYEPWNDL